MLKALGFEFFDEDGNDVGEGAAALAKIEVIRTENKNPLLSGAKFQIACDVKNPLCGKQGATYIFGPQKGVTEEQKEQVDEAMRHYADVTKKVWIVTLRTVRALVQREDSDMHSFRILREN